MGTVKVLSLELGTCTFVSGNTVLWLIDLPSEKRSAAKLYWKQYSPGFEFVRAVASGSITILTLNNE